MGLGRKNRFFLIIGEVWIVVFLSLFIRIILLLRDLFVCLLGDGYVWNMSDSTLIPQGWFELFHLWKSPILEVGSLYLLWEQPIKSIYEMLWGQANQVARKRHPSETGTMHSTNQSLRPGMSSACGLWMHEWVGLFSGQWEGRPFNSWLLTTRGLENIWRWTWAQPLQCLYFLQ